MVNGLEGVILDQANGCRKFDNSRLSHQSVQPWLPRKTDITDIVVLVEGENMVMGQASTLVTWFLVLANYIFIPLHRWSDEL